MQKLEALAIAIVLGLPLASGAVVAAETSATILAPRLLDDHHSMEDPISVKLGLAGEPNRGKTSVLKASLTAVWSSFPSARVSIVAPPEVEVVPYETRTVGLTMGEPKLIAFAVRPLEAGIHELEVLVQAEHAIGTVGSSRVGILDIGEDGRGRFYVDMLPPLSEEGAVGELPAEVGGPGLSFVEEVPEDAEIPEPSAGKPLPPPANWKSGETGVDAASEEGLGAASHSTFQVTGCWFYQTESGGWSPQRFATVQVWDSDDGWDDDLLWQDVTGGNGCFTSASLSRSESDCCFRGNQDVYVRFLTSNTWTRVRTTGGNTYSWSTSVVGIGGVDSLNLGNVGPLGSEFATRSFQYVNNGGYFARNHADVPNALLGMVEVQQPSSRCSGMCYVRDDDDIHIPSHRDRSPDDANHEYGHFVHEKLYGDSYWPSPGGSHNLCDDGQNTGLAWAEGFANFFGPRVNFEVNAPAANGDTSYSRPWNGASWSVDLESGSCGSVLGHDNEMNVARSLWDLRDAANDGTDQSSTSNAFIFDVASFCDDATYRDYYDQGCSWVSNGGSRCKFVTTAFQNNIDYNTNPSVAITSQGSFAWVSGLIVIGASASDLECLPSVEFRVSSNNLCSTFDTVVGTDFLPAYTRIFDTTTIPDDPSVWTCARANDDIRWTDFDTSASHIGVDNTPPVVQLETVCNGVMAAGWCRGSVSFMGDADDALSGIDSAGCKLNGGTVSCGVEVHSSGVHTIVYTATDLAGNVASVTKTFKIDNTSPTLGLAPSGTGGTDGWFRSPVNVSVTAADLHSGLSSVVCEVDGGPEDCAGISLAREGAHVVKATATDVAGNVRTSTLSIGIDDTPPEIALSSACATPGDADWCRGAVNLSLSAVDALSGIWFVNCALDGAATACGSLGSSTDGMHKAFAAGRDKAGNGDSDSLDYKIDATAPALANALSCASPGVSPWCRSNVTVSPTATDATSGLRTWTCILDGAEIPCAPTEVSEEGMHTFESRATDEAGNAASHVTRFGIDAKAPETDIATECTIPDGDEDPATCGGPVRVKTSAADRLSGLDDVTCTLDGSRVECGEFLVEARGWHEVEVIARDMAGNVSRAFARFYVGGPADIRLG